MGISLRAMVALVVALLIGFSSPQSVLLAQDASPPGAPSSGDAGWPRTFEKDGSKVIIYQPQVDKWQDHARIDFRCAIAVTPTGAKEPAYGVMNVKALTEVDHDAQTVILNNIDPDIRFPDLPQDKAAGLADLVKQVVPHSGPMLVSLHRVLACIKNSDHAPQAAKGLGMSPPPIYHSDSPAILVVYLGMPQFKPIENTNVQFAINTNWDILLDTASSTYYLRDGDSWLTSPDPVKGPWTAAQRVPTSFAAIPNDDNWKEVRAHISFQPLKDVPKVFATTQPSELIVTEGAPKFTAITGTNLAYCSNPTQPLFTDTTSSTYYYLVSGRWFAAKSLDGPWQSASDNLPADFASIPSDSPVAFVLASVPKTSDAEDAALLAAIPRKATIDRQAAKVDVTYDGNPQFVDIAGTDLQYATNSPEQVIKANEQYYCCYKGVWFKSASATGPWEVATAVPQEIYSIPPTSPVYNTTYVQIYDSTPTSVDEGYTSGYLGEYIAPTGVVMYGSGTPWAYDAPYNYCWSPAYYSYGSGVYYNPAAAAYCGWGAAAYGPYGAAAYGAHYNPATGAYSRGAAAYGPYGAAGVRQAYNPYTGNYGSHAAASNGYQSWGHTAAQVGGSAVQAGHVAGPAGAAGWAESSSGKSADWAHGAGGGTAVKTGSGDVYAGADGHVYQRTAPGQWQKYSGSGWQNAGTANEQSREQMEQQARARDYGNQMAERSNRGSEGGFGGGGYRGGGRR